MEQRDRLTGERVKLTSIRDADLDEIISWDDDSEFMLNLFSGPAYPRPQVAQREWWDARLKNKDEYHFAIRLIEDGRIIGTFHIQEIEWTNQTGWFSIGLGGKDTRGKGYGAAALTLGIDFAFNSLNLYRLALGVFAFNERAIRLYRRLGFIHEGTQREFLNRDGQRHDMLMFGLLAREWRESREQGIGNREQ
jgi:RimJ/RimL family protein N-acetyltransferase